MAIAAVYLDLTDQGSARLWRWLRATGLRDAVEVRPFCATVADPWECDDPPFALELLMLVEQARAQSADRVAAVVDAAVDRLDEDGGTAAGQLAVWLEVRRVAGLQHGPLGLAAFDEAMDRLRAEVGAWQAEAIELGITGVPAVVLADGSVVQVQLSRDVDDADAADLLRRLADLSGAPEGPAAR